MYPLEFAIDDGISTDELGKINTALVMFTADSGADILVGSKEAIALAA